MNASKSSSAPMIAILCLFLLCVGGLGFFLFAPEEPKATETVYTAKIPSVGKSRTVTVDGNESKSARPFKYVKRPGMTRAIKMSPGETKNVATLHSGKGRIKRGMSFRGPPQRKIPEVPAEILKKTGLRGRLLDSSKNPIANAKVSASGSVRGGGAMTIMGDLPGIPRRAMAGGPSATTDEQGRFVLMGLNFKMSYSLRFDAGEAYRSTSKPAPTLRAEEVVNAGDFTIQKPGSISGYVVDPSGQPLPGATVRIRDAGSEMPIIFGDGEDQDEGPEGKNKNVAVMVAKSSETGEVTVFSSAMSGIKTDKDGRFTFEKLEPGKFTVTASKKGFRKAQVASIVVAEAQHVQNVRLPLGVAGKIRVLVKNEAGEAVAG
ncbi:MAG: carboxypeptidase-like regulatory domain-containing protein, partial [Planctomycetota bacterium]|nr:carboxypeptidase-like regulatory domain-containing protein [Planctomycetota bacterium]